MRTCHINVLPEQIKQIAEIIKGANPDSILGLTGGQSYQHLFADQEKEVSSDNC